MTFSRAFLLLLLTGITTVGYSQAKPQTSPTSTDNQIFELADSNSNQSVLPNLTDPFSRPDASSGTLQLEAPALGVESRADVNEVCYTMRSYKVKRAERLNDNQSGVRGYSTCEMASSYRLRSADSKASVRLK